MMTMDLSDAVVETGTADDLAERVHSIVMPRILPTSNQVRVEANDGIVRLSGRVGSFYARQLWLSGTQQVAGIRRVVDEIEVAAHSPGPVVNK